MIGRSHPASVRIINAHRLSLTRGDHRVRARRRHFSRIISSMVLMRRGYLVKACAVIVGFLAMAAFFAWGFEVHRSHWFPYKQLRLMFYRSGPGDDRREVFPRRQGWASVISVPYIAGSHDPNIDQSGVLTWDRGRAFTGVNLFNSTKQKEVQLIDMRARVLHRWRYPGDADVALAVPMPDGDLIGVEQDASVFRLDRDGNETWRFAARAHHSLEVDDHGHIWTLTRQNRDGAPEHVASQIIEDFIVELTEDGHQIQKISILEMLKRSPFAGLIPTFLRGEEGGPLNDQPPVLDLIHPNHVEAFDGSLSKKSPLYARGNLLVSLRNMNSIAIIDGASLQIVWLWGPGYLFAQHHPTLLENGNILVFNNGFKSSSIVEVDPRTNQVVWEYTPKSRFFSRTMGSCQRLANGNTLITNSESGVVFEVTPGGEIVWRFANPDRDPAFRLVIYRFLRYPTNYFKFLSRHH